jgi:uncharacterized protein YndB with AHSA1/START domain
MKTAEFSITIARPLEGVFAVLSDVEKTAAWNSSAVEEQWTTPGPVGVGSRRRAVGNVLGRRMENEAEVIEFEPNRRWRMRSVSGPRWDTTATFESVDGGTRVYWAWSFQLAGVLRVFEPLLPSLFRRRFSKDLKKLKTLMESGAL